MLLSFLHGKFDDFMHIVGLRTQLFANFAQSLMVRLLRTVDDGLFPEAAGGSRKLTGLFAKC